MSTTDDGAPTAGGGVATAVGGAAEPAPPGAGEPGRTALKSTLRPLHVGSLALGCIIGFGCFVLPGDFLTRAGPLGATIGVVLGAVAMIIVARSYGLLVRTFPVAGGEFAYAYHACGRYHAYVCGWLLTLGYLTIVPLNATALGLLGKFLVPGVFGQGTMYAVAGYEVHLGEVLLASAVVIAAGVLHYRGVKDVGVAQLLMTALLAGTVLAIGVGTVAEPGASLQNLRPHFPEHRSAVAAVLAMLAISPWLYVGFDTLPQAAEEFDFSPAQGLKLMVGAILAGAAMYVIAILATAAVRPWQELLSGHPAWPTREAVQLGLGKPGVVLLGVAATMAIFTGINGFYMATSRLLFSMARARILPEWFARVHPVHRTPGNAVIFTGLLSLVAPWFGRQVLTWVVDMAAVGTAAGYLYTCFAAYVVAKAIGGRGAFAQKAYAVAGVALSAGFIVLLTVPGMPAFMSLPSWVALGVWLGLGAAFFLMRAREYRAMPAAQLDHLILGQSTGQRSR